MRRAVSGIYRSVILTKVRIQSQTGWRSVTLDPDFRQDDGGFAPTPFFTPFSRTMR